MKTTIQGYSFDIAEPYVDGAKMGAIEAKALNQLRAENIGNNQRKAVQAIVEKQPMVAVKDEKGKPVLDDKGSIVQESQPLTEKQLATLQADLTKYDGGYTLDMARGGRVTDPVEKAARDIARALITKTAKAQGFGSLKAYREKVGDDAFTAKVNEVAAKKQVQDQAKVIATMEL